MAKGVRPWQVWWADLSPSQGHEQSGRRPVVVVSSPFHLALSAGALVTVIPLSTVARAGWSHRVRITGGPAVSFALTEQVRTIAASRLAGVAPAWSVPPHEIVALRDVLRRMVDW